MKITYTPNPLDTIVELDEHEVELFRLKLKLEIYEDKMFSAHYALTDSIHDRGPLKAVPLEQAVAEAVRELDPNKWCADEKRKVDERVEQLLNHHLAELKGSHLGDCVCFAMSCSKCHAESLLGIDTLKPFPGKHAMHHIQQAFSRYNPETKQHDGPEVSLEEALEKLRTYKPHATWAGWEAHTERWSKEAAQAYKFLLNYRNTHFPNE